MKTSVARDQNLRVIEQICQIYPITPLGGVEDEAVINWLWHIISR